MGLTRLQRALLFLVSVQRVSRLMFRQPLVTQKVTQEASKARKYSLRYILPW